MSNHAKSRCLGRYFVLGTWLLLVTGCADVSGKGSVTGWLVLDECGPETALELLCADDSNDGCSAFNLETDFYALELFDERSGKLRLQRGGASLHVSDGLVLEFQDIRGLRGRLGESLSVGPEEPIRAALILGSTCPNSTQSLHLTGQVVITHFGTEVGERIAGRIEFLEIRDGRDSLSSLIGVIRGYFDFRYRKGTPFEQFYR